MALVWGLVLVALSLLCWGGQTIAWFAPSTAERLGLTETEDTVEPAFYADVRGEALWDTLTLWVLLAGGILLIADAAAWPYFGMVGGAVYAYFAGRGILARRALQQRGLRIGTPSGVTTAYVMLTVWGLAGIVTVIAAVMALA